MKRVHVGIVLGVLAAGVWGMSNLAARADHHDKPAGQKTAMPECPVMGEPVNFLVSTQTDDGPLYFCCEGCIKKYTANPAKYADAAAEQRKAVAKLPRVQVACPMSGEPIDPKASADHEGGKVYFCCEKCAAKFQKEPAKYKAKLAAAYTYQTKCPISGHEVDPKVSTTAPGGETVYFCCGKCVGAFSADPAKYAAKLAEQGIGLDLKKKK